MLLSTVSIVYRTPSYRISLFEMSEMREPMYGVAIFDQASGRFAALPLSLSPFSRRAAEPLSSLPPFAMLNEPSFFFGGWRADAEKISGNLLVYDSSGYSAKKYKSSVETSWYSFPSFPFLAEPLKEAVRQKEPSRAVQKAETGRAQRSEEGPRRRVSTAVRVLEVLFGDTGRADSAERCSVRREPGGRSAGPRAWRSGGCQKSRGQANGPRCQHA